MSRRHGRHLSVLNCGRRHFTTILFADSNNKPKFIKNSYNIYILVTLSKRKCIRLNMNHFIL